MPHTLSRDTRITLVSDGPLTIALCHRCGNFDQVTPPQPDPQPTAQPTGWTPPRDRP